MQGWRFDYSVFVDCSGTDLGLFACGIEQLAPVGAHWRVDLVFEIEFAAVGANWDFCSNMAQRRNLQLNGLCHRSGNMFECLYCI